MDVRFNKYLFVTFKDNKSTPLLQVVFLEAFSLNGGCLLPVCGLGHKRITENQEPLPLAKAIINSVLHIIEMTI